MKPLKYRLTIFEPSGVFEPLVSFEAASPFQAITRGSLVNPSLWPRVAERADLKDKLLKVVGLEHGVQEFDDHILHILDVFTQAVENTEQARRSFFIS